MGYIKKTHLLWKKFKVAQFSNFEREKKNTQIKIYGSLFSNLKFSLFLFKKYVIYAEMPTAWSTIYQKYLKRNFFLFIFFFQKVIKTSLSWNFSFNLCSCETRKISNPVSGKRKCIKHSFALSYFYFKYCRFHMSDTLHELASSLIFL